MMRQKLDCLSNCQRNLSEILLLTRVVTEVWQKGSVGGNLAENTLNSVRYQIIKLSCYLIPRSLCTRSSRQDRIMLVVRYQEDAFSELRLTML
jgi:hypothetical protein